MACAYELIILKIRLKLKCEENKTRSLRSGWKIKISLTFRKLYRLNSYKFK